MSFLGSGNTGCSFNIKTLNMCVCACVCLCVLGRTHKGARERERETAECNESAEIYEKHM